MHKKICVAILCGGQSAEHQVSLQSTKNVVEAIDTDKYQPVIIGIAKDGTWSLYPQQQFLANADDPSQIALGQPDEQVALVPGYKGQLLSLRTLQTLCTIDVCFPVLHGPLGEDGTIQGLLKLCAVPYVGPDVLGSAIAMDKDVMKRLFREANIPTPAFLVHQKNGDKINFSEVKRKLGVPIFIKPANLGSSVGVSQVDNEELFNQAIATAFKYDNKIIIEESIAGQEIECSVLGNENPIASIPGEIIVHKGFYSYDAKYIDKNNAILQIPADLPPQIVKQVQQLAVETFQNLCCEGMARVDFFVEGKKRVLVNEINTIPGFTQISMYPKLWEKSGIPYSNLIDRLLQLAIQRFYRDKSQ